MRALGGWECVWLGYSYLYFDYTNFYVIFLLFHNELYILDTLTLCSNLRICNCVTSYIDEIKNDLFISFFWFNILNGFFLKNRKLKLISMCDLIYNFFYHMCKYHWIIKSCKNNVVHSKHESFSTSSIVNLW
jgi:hypothetical protein